MGRQAQLEISERQAYALGVIRALYVKSTAPPTLVEIGRCLDISKQAVSRLLDQLESKGYITRAKDVRFCAIRLTGKELPYGTQKGRAA